MNRRAFTLVELIAVMVILGFLTAVAAPLVAAAGRTFADAADQRAASASLSYALDRAARTLGESAGPVVTAQPGRIAMAGGAQLERIGTTLWLTVAGEAASPLCQNVTSFAIAYLADDGRTDTIGSPSETQRINIAAAVGDVELATSVLLRQWEGAP